MIPKVKKILYASDLSENSLPALSWAITLAHQHDAQITFLNVIEDVSPHASTAIRSFMGEDKWKEMNEAHVSEANAEIETRIRSFCDNVKNDLAACQLAVNDIVIKRGEPVEVIINEARAQGCDLIVMGTHGAGIFKDAMIGSTARRVIRRSNLPVFVIPLSNP